MDSLVYVALSTIDFEKISLNVFNEICMFCFVKAEKLELVNTIPRTELFWKLCSNIQITNTGCCPQQICHVCLQTFKSVSKFVDQVNGNITRFKELYQQKLNQFEKSVSVLTITPKLEHEEVEFIEHGEAELVKIEEIINKPSCADDDDDDNDEIQHKENNEDNGKKDSITTTNLIKCHLCDKEFATYFKLRYHRLSHKAPEEFLCHTCGKKFERRTYLKKHTLIVHMKVKPHKCDICDKAFFAPRALKEHRNSHTGDTPYQCNYCGQRFTRYTNLVTHIQYHKLKNGEVEQNETTKPYLKLQCETCKQIFTSTSSLKVHIGKKHKNSSSTPTSDEKFSCKECKEEFTTRVELRVHVRQEHVNDEICPDCGKFFKKKSTFLKHMSIHNKEDKITTFSCDVCNKTFKRKDNLQAHQRIHTGIKLYNCKTCGVGYNKSNSYKKHLQTHEKVLE